LADNDSSQYAVGQGAGGEGLVEVRDGSGVLLRRFEPFPGWTGEVRVAGGDVNGDGVADGVVGAGPGAPGGHVKVFGGATGAELRSFFAFDGFEGGVFVAAGDVDGDGKADVIVGAAANGHVKVFDGASGAEIRSFLAYPGFLGAVTVGVGDVNGDGK